MRPSQYNLIDVPKRDKFNFPGLYEKGMTTPTPAVHSLPIQQDEPPKKQRATKKSTVEDGVDKPSPKRKTLGFGTGKIL